MLILDTPVSRIWNCINPRVALYVICRTSCTLLKLLIVHKTYDIIYYVSILYIYIINFILYTIYKYKLPNQTTRTNIDTDEFNHDLDNYI